jgi:hypothetical protein
MDDFKQDDDADEDKEKDEDIDPAKIIKEVAKTKGKKNSFELPHTFDIHTPNEALEVEDVLVDPRFDEDDPASVESDEMDEDEDELESGAGFFGGSDFGDTHDASGLF